MLNRVRRRAAQLAEWVRVNAPDTVTEQKHLDEGSSERAYWHHGYLSALRDVMRADVEDIELN